MEAREAKNKTKNISFPQRKREGRVLFLSAGSEEGGAERNK